MTGSKSFGSYLCILRSNSGIWNMIRSCCNLGNKKSPSADREPDHVKGFFVNISHKLVDSLPTCKSTSDKFIGS